MRRRYLSVLVPIVLMLMSLCCTGCHPSFRILNPRRHAASVEIPKVVDHFGNPWSYEHKIRGDILLARGDVEAAVNEYQMAATGDPGDAWIQIQFADALLQKNDMERAENHITKAIVLDPAIGRAWTTVAEIQNRRGQTGKAFESARFGSRTDRTDTSGLQWMGDHLATSKNEADRQQALSCYQRALVRSRTNPALYLAAGQTALSLSYTQLAQRYVQTYLNMYGDDTDAVARIAQTLSQTGHPQSAIHLYGILLARNPTLDSIRTRLVALYLDTHQYDLAVRAVHEFYLAPTTPSRVIERTNWLLRANAPWDARKLIIENFSGAPMHPHIRFQLAAIEWTLRRDEVALALLNFPEDVPKDLVEKVDTLRKKIVNSQKNDHP